jgi:hypothetical protein
VAEPPLGVAMAGLGVLQPVQGLRAASAASVVFPGASMQSRPTSRLRQQTSETGFAQPMRKGFGENPERAH